MTSTAKATHQAIPRRWAWPHSTSVTASCAPSPSTQAYHGQSENMVARAVGHRPAIAWTEPAQEMTRASQAEYRTKTARARRMSDCLNTQVCSRAGVRCTWVAGVRICVGSGSCLGMSSPSSKLACSCSESRCFATDVLPSFCDYNNRVSNHGSGPAGVGSRPTPSTTYSWIANVSVRIVRYDYMPVYSRNNALVTLSRAR